MAEKINNIHTMYQDLTNLKERGDGSLYREVAKVEKTQSDERLKIEEQIKRKQEEQIKGEEEELLRIRKAERLKEIEEEKREEEKPKPQPEIKPEISSEIMPEISSEIMEKPVEPKPVKKITEKETLLLEKENLKKNRRNIKEELVKLQEQKDPLAAERNIISSRLVEVKRGFESIATKEQKIEKLQRDLEEKTLVAKTADQRKNLEKQRWVIEEKRRDLEKQRWPWDEKLKEISAKLKDVDKKSADIDSKETELNNKYNNVAEKERDIDFKLRKIELSGILNDIKGLKSSFSKKRVEVGVDINQIKSQLKEVLEQDKKINEEKQAIEQKESGEQNSTEKRELEKQRWAVEEKRRKIETKRWELDEEKERLENNLSKIEDRIDSVSIKEKTILSEISEIDKELNETPITPELKKPEFKKEEATTKPVDDERKKSIEEARKRIQTLRQVSVVEKPEPKPEPMPEPIKEYKKNLNEEIPLKLEEFIERVPKKPSKEKKIWLRITIVVFVIIILTAIVTFWYWYFGVRNEYKVENTNQEQPGGSDNPNGTGGSGEFSISNPLFTVDDIRTLSINNLDEISPLLAQMLQETEVDNKYTRIVIKKSNKEISLSEFNQALSIRMPDGFYTKVEDKFTLFAYSQPQGNRLGLVVKVSDSSELSSILKNQEATMEGDFKILFGLVGQTKPGITSYFRSASNVKGYEGPNFRYQTISTNDIGICYISMNNYFVLSSSWRSMERLLGKLEIPSPKQELTMELKLGDRNEEVKTLQIWLAKDVQVYPKGIISGYYGSLTKQAVIKFQEKYASEILAPQGLETGTGIVDPSTRNKLNELYATPQYE